MTAEAAKNSVEFVRNLSPEDREEVLVYLVREVIRVSGGNALIPVQTPAGESLGYFVPPAIAAEQLRSVLPTLSPEQRAVTERALADLSKTFDMDEYLDELTARDRD
jgi:hypothetical protein